MTAAQNGQGQPHGVSNTAWRNAVYLANKGGNDRPAPYGGYDKKSGYDNKDKGGYDKKGYGKGGKDKNGKSGKNYGGWHS